MVNGEGESKLTSAFHKTIKKVSSDIEEMKFNTAIAAMMGLLNEICDAGTLTVDEYKIFIRLLCPIAPHICEELWEELGESGFCSLAEWPVHDEAKTVDSTVEVAVQVNGKLKCTVVLPLNCDKDTALATAKADPKVASAIEGKTIVKEILIPNKIINVVVK